MEIRQASHSLDRLGTPKMSFAHLDSLTSLGGGVWDLADNASAPEMRINARKNMRGGAREGGSNAKMISGG